MQSARSIVLCSYQITGIMRTKTAESRLQNEQYEIEAQLDCAFSEAPHNA